MIWRTNSQTDRPRKKGDPRNLHLIRTRKSCGRTQSGHHHYRGTYRSDRENHQRNLTKNQGQRRHHRRHFAQSTTSTTDEKISSQNMHHHTHTSHVWTIIKRNSRSGDCFDTRYQNHKNTHLPTDEKNIRK